MNSRSLKTVLIVDDQTIIALHQKVELEAYGYAVMLSSSGEDAIAKASDPACRIDIILMDIDLGPGLSGPEAAKQILSIRQIPIMFLSSHTEPEIVETTEKISSYGYVVKNSGITILDASIKMAFKLFDAHRNIEHELVIRVKAEEELQLRNQQLKALNDELSAAMEEMEAANEELIATSTELQHKERALKEALADLNQSQAIARIGSWKLDLASSTFTATDEGLRIFGFPPGTNPTFMEVVACMPPEDRQHAHDVLTNALKTGEPYTIEMNITRSDNGMVRRIISNAAILTRSDGSPYAVLGTNQDITEQRMMEQELRDNVDYLHAVMDSADEAILVHDAGTGAIIDVNKSMCALWGYSYEKALTLSIADLSQPGSDYTQEGALRFLRKAEADGPQTFPWMAQDHSGRPFPITVTLRHLRFKGKGRCVATVRTFPL
jgi:PAS domain S-box-containing protein